MSTHDGGKPKVRDVRNYQPPKGPSNIGDRGVGLHGSVHRSGSQGHHGSGERESGSVGLHGTTQRHGSEHE